MRASIFEVSPPNKNGKRDKTSLEFDLAVAAFLEKDGSDFRKAIDEAFRTGNTRVFRLLIEAQEYAQSIPHTQFSKRVIETIKTKIKLQRKLGRLPTKKEVREAVSFDEEVTSRWTEIFKVAQLGYLPKGISRRGKSRH